MPTQADPGGVLTLLEYVRRTGRLRAGGNGSWHQKFTTNFLRPVTAIRNARKLDNPAIQEDPDGPHFW